MNANANATIIASQRRAWLRAIPFYFLYPDIRNRLINDYKQEFGVADTPLQILQSIRQQHEQHFPRQNAPWVTNAMPNPPHQSPLEYKHTGKQRKENVDADRNELLRRGDNGSFNIACHFDNGHIFYVAVPQLSDDDRHYHSELSNIARIYAPNNFLTDMLFDYNLKKFDNRMNAPSSSVCLDKGWNGFHATAAHVDIVNGSTQPIPMVKASVALDTSKQVDWSNVHVNNINQAERNRRQQLWDTSNGQSLNEPPPPNLRNHQSYVHSNPSRQTCPSKNDLEDLLTSEGYDKLIAEYSHIILDMPDGGDGYMQEMCGLHCHMPSICQKPATLIANPKHLNKRAHEVGNSTQLYQEIRADYPDDGDDDEVNERASECHSVADGPIFDRVQSDDFVNRTSYGSFDHWYASSSIIGAAAFLLTHQDGGNLIHYPHASEDFSRSAMLQVLANRDMKRVGSHGLDATNQESLSHVIRGRLPIPIIASYHVTWGPPEHPILGATFTVHEECYRPTLGRGIVKFSFA